MPRKTITIFILSSLLVSAIGLVIYGQTRPLTSTFHGRLADLLPPAPPGWTRTEQPIADTPEMRQKVDEMLSFDDGVFYLYTSGSLRLSVYVAYWQPGKMSARLVAGHTPDVCWVGAGWVCQERGAISYELSAIRGQRAEVGGQTSDISPQISAGSAQVSGFSPQISILPPAEARTFVVNDTTEHVWFWHMVDGTPQSYGTGKQPPWHAMFTDMLRGGLNQRSEQFFIRLSSPQPLDDPALQPTLDAVLRSLPVLASSS